MKHHHQQFLIQRQCALSTLPAAKKRVMAHYMTLWLLTTQECNLEEHLVLQMTLLNTGLSSWVHD